MENKKIRYMQYTVIKRQKKPLSFISFRVKENLMGFLQLKIFIQMFYTSLWTCIRFFGLRPC